MLAGFFGSRDGKTTPSSTSGATTLSSPFGNISPQEKCHAELIRDADEMLSRELKNVTFQERIQIQEEIHGVADPCPPESPEMIQDALHFMQQHLDAIPHKPIHDKVPSTSYIHAQSFRLRFLRCEVYDTKRAAERYLRFINHMYAEWGSELLLRPLRLSDLETKTGKNRKQIMKLLKGGHAQILPFRDRSGRLIHFCHPEACNHKEHISVCALARL